MKKRNILKKNSDFNRIIQNKKPFRYKYISIYKEPIQDDNYYFGFSVGKKLGNAVTRNKVKRQLKSIVHKKNYHNNFNCIIMVNRSILGKDFSEIEKDLSIALEKMNLIK